MAQYYDGDDPEIRMPITTDFLVLYQELRVTPECSIAHFKSAYRRRVAELHPDRTSSDTRPASMERLQSLLRLHEAAMEFYDRHGRLPGSNRTTPNPFGHARTRPETQVQSRSRSRIWIFAIVAAAAVTLCVVLPSVEFAAPDRETRATSIQMPAGSEEHRARTLNKGMDESDVRRIQGEPTLAATDRWEYGPSSVRFEHHKLVGWYSSPLRPLKIGVPLGPAARNVD
jgi:hypothetical protein